MTGNCGIGLLPGDRAQLRSHSMLALIAAVLFAIAFIINAAGIATDAVFSPLSLMLVGLALLALHLTGQGPALPAFRSRRR
jgi:hypothetical protein